MPVNDAIRLSLPTQNDLPADFPVGLAPSRSDLTLEESLAWVRDNRRSLLQSLNERGAILFRGFPVADAAAFDRFIGAFDLDSFTYGESLSNAVRVNVTERVFTANEAPPEVEIFLHHEMAQTPLFPSRLFFFCEIAPTAGGATPLCRSDLLLQRLEEQAPRFIERCARAGVRYVNTMPGSDDADSGQGRSWRSTLGVASAPQAEARLTALGYDFEWLGAETLRVTTASLPAIRQLADGRRVFFNQLIAAFRGWKDSRNDPRKSLRFGDDTPMDAEALELAATLADRLSFDLPWQAGDVALVDNYLVMHGRRPFEGSRRVLASLVADTGDRLI